MVGGIGPEATVEFYSKLISKLQKSNKIKSNKDFPQIIINSIPAPELINLTVSKEELKYYIEGLKDLEKHNPDFIVMVCNTIHLFYEELQKNVKTEILNLPKEVEKTLNKMKVKTLTVIGTPLTINSLYAFDQFKYLNLNSTELDKLSKAIFNFNKGFEKENQTKFVEHLCKKYIKKGSDLVILGCTELAVMLKDTTLPTLNTIDVLVDTVLSKFP